MINIPKLPEKEELRYKENQLLLSFYEQLEASSKFWFLLLLIFVLVAVPAKIILEKVLSNRLVTAIPVPAVNLEPYATSPIEVLKSAAVPVSGNIYSVYAQVLNPNSEISARYFSYEFVISDEDGELLKRVAGKDYILAQESKFVIIPSLELPRPPAAVAMTILEVKWTKWQPPFEVRLDILQQNSGTNLDNQFFVEGLVKNLNGFLLKKVGLTAIVFDKTNTNVVAVNETTRNDVYPKESRYFRLLWPTKFINFGRVQVQAFVNPFEHNFAVFQTE